MNASQVIAQCIRDDGNDPSDDLRALVYAHQQDAVRIMQESRTVIVLLALGNGQAEIHLYSQDRPKTMIRSLMCLVRKIQATSIRRVYGKPDNLGRLANTLKFLTKQGVAVEPSDDPNYEWMANV